MRGVLLVLLPGWPALALPAAPTVPIIERVVFTVSLEQDGSNLLPSVSRLPHRRLEPGALPSAALLAAMRRCGAGAVAEEMLKLEHEGAQVHVTAIVPKGSPTSGHAILRAVGTNMECFTPELQRMQSFGPNKQSVKNSTPQLESIRV